MKKGGNAEANTDTDDAQEPTESRESGHVSDTSSFLQTYTLFFFFTQITPLKYFFLHHCLPLYFHESLSLM